MREKIALVFIVFVLIGCAQSEKKTGKIKMALYESYNLSEIYASIISANHSIRQKQLDSITKSSSGIALLDKINSEVDNNDTLNEFSVDDYPLFQVLYPNIKILDNGTGAIDSSAIIGFESDSVKLFQYLNQTRSLFPGDIDWKIGGIRNEKSKVKCLHAFKISAQKIDLSDSDIDSVVVIRIGMKGLVGIAEKIADLKSTSTYWVKLKFKKELSSKLEDKTYSLIIKLESQTFSSSVVNFISNPNQEVILGEMEIKN